MTTASNFSSQALREALAEALRKQHTTFLNAAVDLNAPLESNFAAVCSALTAEGDTILDEPPTTMQDGKPNSLALVEAAINHDWQAVTQLLQTGASPYSCHPIPGKRLVSPVNVILDASAMSREEDTRLLRELIRYGFDTRYVLPYLCFSDSYCEAPNDEYFDETAFRHLHIESNIDFPPSSLFMLDAFTIPRDGAFLLHVFFTHCEEANLPIAKWLIQAAVRLKGGLSARDLVQTEGDPLDPEDLPPWRELAIEHDALTAKA